MNGTGAPKALLAALAGGRTARPPIWLMRQAGRYLPEYRAVRAEAGGFLELCYDPHRAAEVTLQPIRRFGFDAAILFADILLVPQALGLELRFGPGEGPILSPVKRAAGLRPAGEIHETLSPIYETVRLVRAALPPETALIGFAGAPWTVASYMIAGRGTPDQAPARALLREDPAAFAGLIDRLVEATIEYLSRQIEAGAEAVKLFDSWAGSLSEREFETASVEPCRRIAAALRARHPGVPMIGFPRGVSGAAARRFVEATGVEGVAIGQDLDPRWARDHLQPLAAVQGNLDPALMVTGGAAMLDAAAELIEILSAGPHIFNLGHGITPEADPRHVEALVRLVKG